MEMTESQAKALLAQLDADTIEAVIGLCYGTIKTLGQCFALDEEVTEEMAQPIVQSIRDWLAALTNERTS